MAGAIVDTIAVSSEFQPEGFAAGLAESERLFQASVQRITAATPTLKFNLTTPATDQAGAAFAQLNVSIAELNASLAKAAAVVNGFFQGVVEGASQEVAAMEQAKAATAGLAAQSSALAASQGAAVLSTEGLALGATHAHRAMRTMAVAMATIGAEAIGVNGPVVRLAEGMLLFSGGEGVVFGAAAAFAALAVAMDLVEGPARRAREETDKLLKSLQDASRGRLPPFEQIGRQLDDLQTKIREATDRLVELQRRSQAQGRGGTLLFPELPQEIQRMKDLTAQVFELRALQAQAATDAFNAAVSAQRQRLAERSSALAEAPGLGTDTPASLRERAAELARLTAIIHSQTASLAERNTAAQQFKAITDGVESALERQRKLALQIAEAWAAVRTSAAEASANAVAVVQRAQAVATVPGGEQFAPLIQRQRAAGLVQPTQEITAGLQAAEAATRGLEDQLNRMGSAADRNFRRFKAAVEDTRTSEERLRDTLKDFASGSARILDVAHSLGLIGQQAEQSLVSVVALGAQIAAVAAEGGLGNILGAVAGGLAVVGGLLGGGGPSAAQLEHDRILEENTQRLADLNNTIARNAGGGLTATAAELAAVGAAARAAALQATPFTGAPGPDFGRELIARNAAITEANRQFADALQNSGLSLREFAEIVKQQTGIQILDTQGRLVADALQQANDALKIFEEQITHFSDNLDTLSQRLTVEDKLGISGRSSDANVAALQRTRELELTGLQLSTSEEAYIRSLDLTTAEGRAAFKQFQIRLYEAAAAGQLTATELGKFKNVDELLGPIGDAADQLNAFTDATNAATKSLQDLNVPVGFRRFALEAASQLPPAPAPVTLHGTEFNPRLPGTDGSMTPLLTATQALTTIAITVQPGAIVVEGTGKDAESVAQAVVAQLRDIAMAQSGDTLQVPVL